MLENSISLKVTRPIKLLLQHRKYNSYFGSENCPLSKDTFVRHNKVRQQFLLYCNMLILLEGPSICYLNLPPLLYNWKVHSSNVLCVLHTWIIHNVLKSLFLSLCIQSRHCQPNIIKIYWATRHGYRHKITKCVPVRTACLSRSVSHHPFHPYSSSLRFRYITAAAVWSVGEQFLYTCTLSKSHKFNNDILTQFVE